MTENQPLGGNSMWCGHKTETEWRADHYGCCERGRFVACSRECLIPHMEATGDCGASRVVTMPREAFEAHVRALGAAGYHA